LLFGPMGRLLESKLHVVAKIAPSLGRSGVATGAAAEKLVKDAARSAAARKCLPEDFKRIVESATASSSHPWIKGSMAILVICGPLLRVTQCLVSFAYFLKFFFGRLVARVLVRMKLDGKLAVRFLYLLVRSTSFNAQDLVVITLG